MNQKAAAAKARALPVASFTPGAPAERVRAPMYWRLLRLRHVRPNGWQRALFIEGSIVVAGLLALAGVASAWSLLVLPLVVAATVKAHDVLIGALMPATGSDGGSGDDV